MDLINKRYQIRSEYPKKYANFVSPKLNYYKAIDTLHNNQDVLLEIYKLPENDEAKSLAITYWERKVRLTRKALALDHDNCLLSLIDAFIDKINNQLIIVFKKYGLSLMEWYEESDNLSILGNLDDEKSRKQVWTLILKFCKGINILHEGKIIHRNINPSTVFHSDQAELPQLRFGGFAWGIYLYNMQEFNSIETFKSKSISIFNPPEKVEKKNAFLFDIYSVGMLIAYILFPKIDFSLYTTEKECKDLIISIITQIQNTNVINEKEAAIILSCIDGSSRNRFTSMQAVIEAMQSMIIDLQSDEIEINEPLEIYWWNDLESPFIKDMANKSVKIDDLLMNPDKWLDSEFIDSKIYATGIKEHPLVIVTAKNEMFELKSIISRAQVNEDLANLYCIRKNTKKIFRAILNTQPICICRKGFCYIGDKRKISKYWKKFHTLAKNELKRTNLDKSEEDLFQERLKVMFEAEKNLDLKSMLYFKYPFYQPKEIKKNNTTFEVANILVSNKAGEIDKPIGRERRMIIDLLNEYRYEYDGIIELTPEIDPSANWETGREWKIVKIDETRLEVTLEREKIKRNKELASEGLIRPSEMSRSLSLYKRKKYIIEDIKDNHILLSALLHPKINSFYLGIENDNDNKVINDILNTIPLFLVQGPPGCGKTWVASTIVAKILQRDPFARILLSAKDHQPLDHLLKEVIEKIPNNIEPKPIIIRTISTDREKGYKEKALALKYSGHVQTVQMFQHAKNRVSHELPREIQNSWIKIIDENIKEPQLKWMDEVLKSANIVFTTSTSSSVDWLRKNASSFDYIIIEEAAKSYPLELLLPMNLGYRWLLIGDQKQLPPYKYNDMKSEVIEYFDKELEPQFENIDEMTKVRTQCIEEIKFFEYIYNKLVITDVLFSDKIYHPCFRLETNWRFPPVISDMISSIFYNTKFITKKPPTKINDPFTEPDYLTNNELIWIDTPKAHEDPTFLESKDQVGSSFNEGEIKLLINFLQKLKVSPEINVKDLEIVIITPYKTQQELIINKLNDYTETNINCKDIAQNVYTVDSYQGEQADIIIISLVRNNEFTSDVQALGFLTFLERINVMFSRVKKRMIIIGCAKFIKDFSGPDSLEIKQVLNYVENNGIVIPYKNLRL